MPYKNRRKIETKRKHTLLKKLFLRTAGKYVCGLALFGALLFVPAGTLRYPYGWLMIAILFIPMLAAGVVLMLKNPALLKKRLNAKEEEREQKRPRRRSAG